MCPNQPQQKRQPRKSQSTRTEEALAALREAALKLIISEGISNLKLAQVGIHAGYSRGIVNYHFGTKYDLLIDLFDELTLTSEAIYRQTEAHGLATLEKIFDSISEMAKQQPEHLLGLFLLVHEAASTTDPRLRARAAEHNQRVRKSMEAMISEELTRNGALSTVKSSNLATLIFGLIHGISSQWLAERETFDVVNALQFAKSQLPTILQAHNK